MATPLQRTRKLYLRLATSALCYIIFLGMNVNGALIVKAPIWGTASILPLILAMIMLPRRVPHNYADTPEQERINADTTRRLIAIHGALPFIRGVYLIVALVALLALPRLAPAPI